MAYGHWINEGKRRIEQLEKQAEKDRAVVEAALALERFHGRDGEMTFEEYDELLKLQMKLAEATKNHPDYEEGE